MGISRWERLAPLTGLLGIAVILGAIIGIGGNTPGVDASAGRVLSFYHAHRDRQMNAAFIAMIGVGIWMFFLGTFRHAMRRGSATGRLANVAFAGGIFFAVGVSVAITLHLALADSAKYGDAAVTHTLNILDNDSFIPMSAGLAVTVLAGSACALRNGVLPKWLGIVGVIAGVASFTPVGFVASMVCAAWVIVTSIVLYLRQDTSSIDVPAQSGQRSAHSLPVHS